MAAKRRRKRLSEAQRQEIANAREKGLSLGEIASKFRISRSYVSKLCSPNGGAATAGYERWRGHLRERFEQVPERYCYIDQARRRALDDMSKTLELPDYLRVRAELDRLIVRIPLDDLDYGGGARDGWIVQAIRRFAESKVGG